MPTKIYNFTLSRRFGSRSAKPKTENRKPTTPPLSKGQKKELPLGNSYLNYSM